VEEEEEAAEEEQEEAAEEAISWKVCTSGFFFFFPLDSHHHKFVPFPRAKAALHSSVKGNDIMAHFSSRIPWPRQLRDFRQDVGGGEGNRCLRRKGQIDPKDSLRLRRNLQFLAIFSRERPGVRPRLRLRRAQKGAGTAARSTQRDDETKEFSASASASGDSSNDNLSRSNPFE